MKACVRRRSMQMTHWSSEPTLGPGASSPVPASRTERRALAVQPPTPRRRTVCCTLRSSPKITSYCPGGSTQASALPAEPGTSKLTLAPLPSSSQPTSSKLFCTSGSSVQRGATPPTDCLAHTSQVGRKCSLCSDIIKSSGSLLTFALLYEFGFTATARSMGSFLEMSRSDMGTCEGRATCSREAVTPAANTAACAVFEPALR
mmetsp:Transcript_31046/g.78678  ORF Transcript_31046/g.78678 Transcript_31046/m.78678 type:complete len:203 (-) Transcript_31046:1697-2305(-)